MGYEDRVDIEDFVGKIFSQIDGGLSSEELVFHIQGGGIYRMFHDQDCCESVNLDDIEGSLTDLVESPILSASEDTNSSDAQKDSDESWTWTFYRIATTKGSVVLKWYGSSNGYYSEGVSIEKAK